MTSASANERLKAILKAGKLFEGKYRIMKPLGAGSFAVVVQARHEVMNRDVAIKFLKPKMVEANPEVSRRFINEVQIASRLKHPNLVSIYDFGKTEEGIYYMVQEFVDGVTLDEVMPKGKPLPRERVHDIITQVLSCLGVAHSHKIIHRDLKPSNLMTLQRDGREQIKILDFGVAKLLEEQGTGPVRQSTKFIGTPIYMSPEQILGQEVHPSSDLYSVGLMLYEMLTGQPPIQAQKVAEVVQKHLDERPFAFPYMGMIDDHTSQVILRATERHPEFRFEHAAAFKAALDGGTIEERASSVSEATEAEDEEEFDLLGRGRGADVDVFSGKNYLSMPEDDYGDGGFEPLLVSDDAPSFSPGQNFSIGDAPAPSFGATPANAPSRSRKPTPAPQSGRRSSRRPDPVPDAQHRAGSSLEKADEAESQLMRELSTGGLELDMDVVRDVQRKRTASMKPVPGGTNRRPMPMNPNTSGSALMSAPAPVAESPFNGVNIMWAGVGFACLYASFSIGSAMLYDSGSLGRLLGGLAPIAAATLWAASASSHYIDVMERWVVPISKRAPAVLGALVLFIVFVMPSSGRLSLYHDATWFYEPLPDVPPLTWFEGMTESGARAIASICETTDHKLYGGEPPGSAPTTEELLEPEPIDLLGTDGE